MKRRANLTKAKNMSKIWFLSSALMIVGLCATEVFALDPMGPPTAGLRQGQFKVGVDYSYSTMDIELSEGQWIEHLDGLFYDSGEAVSFVLKDFKVSKGYANFGYGVADYCESFLRMGGANAEFGDSIWEDDEKFYTDTDFAIGGGIKATFYEEDNLKLGGLFQANWAEYDGELKALHWAASDLVGINMAEVQIAVGATYTWTDLVSIYGGPFLHFIHGDLEDIYSEVDVGSGSLLTSKYTWDVNEDSIFGGYVGVRLGLVEECSFCIELQHTAAACAFGASLMWRF